ncbi:antibiotic biosynthesis monooxygenase family protein [Lentzea flaviverrucosa]|uniref:Heme-degrading monooxygenase HmoA n=1 Tax=Lentzea flaviverrucosa TaxID=200379 RepID=A0A1H9XCE1_9PSEU|nr:antibiotic biosynthesis monooxygenase [Lentzea flaviverrucosa]RDI21658.1 heme-degrading monooxygenase HmoA [Lentzea flaviverrucosa]SES43323.1 Heme-degrading monooxygenase HmoA [Lentzea flaviverrucosa]
MITEHALLDVLPGSAEEFEWAFGEARELISASPGFRGLELLRCLDTPSRYLLLVRWDTVESHTVGFRQGSSYARWSELLHRFYSPFPVVSHYESALSTSSSVV